MSSKNSNHNPAFSAIYNAEPRTQNTSFLSRFTRSLLTIFIIHHSFLSICSASTNAMPVAIGGTLGLDTNGIVVSPPGFWASNKVVITTTLRTNLDEMVQDITEQTVDVMLPDALSSYYTKAQSDARYADRTALFPSSQITTLNNWNYLSGFDLATVLSNLDRTLGTYVTGGGVGGTGSVYNITTNLYLSAGTTNATGLHVAFSPTQYSPVNATAEEHLRAIDSRLGYLRSLIISNAVPSATQTLSSVQITGDSVLNEGVSSPYVLTAYFSDGSSSNVTTSALWSFVEPPPVPTIALSNNILIVGSFIGNTSITLRAIYSFGGIAREDTHPVTLLDTNPPALSSLYITGQTTVPENAATPYRAYAVFDQGYTNDVTSAATWSLSGHAASTMTNSTLYTGEVSSNAAATVQAQYAWDSVIKSATQSITITGTTQRLLITINYNGYYNTGTLHVDCYNNRQMQNWPLKQWTVPNFSAYGTHTITNTLTEPYTGDTYWYVWLDTDNNNILNGVMAFNTGSLRFDEPAGFPSNQPIAITPGTDKSMSITLTDVAPGKHTRVGWLASDVGGTPRKKIQIQNQTGTLILKSTILTNRTYYCEWDTMVGNYTVGSTNGVPSNTSGYCSFMLFNINANGSDDMNYTIYGYGQPW